MNRDPWHVWRDDAEVTVWVEWSHLPGESTPEIDRIATTDGVEIALTADERDALVLHLAELAEMEGDLAGEDGWRDEA